MLFLLPILEREILLKMQTVGGDAAVGAGPEQRFGLARARLEDTPGVGVSGEECHRIERRSGALERGDRSARAAATENGQSDEKRAVKTSPADGGRHG